MLQQGAQFHTQLVSILQKLMAEINDYVMKRTYEKNELVNRIAGQNFGSLGNPSAYGQPPGYQPTQSQYHYGGPAPSPYPQPPPAPRYPGYPPGYGYQ